MDNTLTQTTISPAPKRPRSRYIPALDGIRTLAVAGVVLYHLNIPWAQGGLLGVTVFFVLSGFLITRLLIIEQRATGAIDLKGFWVRRLRRLMPAVVAVVIATAALCTVFNHVMLTKMRPDIIPSLLFFNNWWQILRNVSYFDALGDPSPLTHFWSLAIEEQFYLVWPLLLIVAYKLGQNNKTIRRGTLALAAASALAMAVLYNPTQDPSRVYYGTDTRVFSLLLGAWLAFIPARRLSAQGLIDLWQNRAKEAAGEHMQTAAAASPMPRRVTSMHRDGEPESMCHIPDVIGIIGLIGLLALMACTNGYTAFPYRGGTLLCSLFTLMLIVPCLDPRTWMAKLFSLKPLVWLGKRSYGIYLWHYPLLLLMNPVADITAKPWWVQALQVALVIAVAEFSYRFIETPFRHGALGRTAHALHAKKTTPARILRTRPVPFAVAAAVLIVALGGIAFVPDTSALSAEGAAILEQGTDADNKQAQTDDASQKPAADTGSADTKSSGNEFGANAYDITMVGDSVSLRAVDTFNATFPHGHINAMKNRQFGAGVEVYQQLVNNGQAGKVAVFALGTNGPMSDDAIDNLMSIVGDKRIAIFVNTRSPQPWVTQTNDTLARAKDRHKNVRVIDWYGYSEGNNDLFDGDGTHLSSQGVKEYIGLVQKEAEPYLPTHLEDADQQQAYKDRISALEETLKNSLSKALPKVIRKEFPSKQDNA